MIKQVKYRDFRNNLTRLKFFECDVFDGEGVLIGQWKPANNGLPMRVAQGLEDVCTSTPNRLESDDKMAKFKALQSQIDVRHAPKASDNVEKMASVIPSHSISEVELFECELCKREKAEVYEVWEEGEERRTCRDCIASRVPPKMLTGVLKRSKRVSE